ncbi:MAG: hypothetical protein ACE5NC_02150 [Anaerolineae bacterium]
MELRHYWEIVVRRGWVVVLVPLVALISWLVLRPAPTVGYQGTLRFMVGITPPEGPLTGDELYSFELASEFIVDDFAEVVKSRAFAQDVAARLLDEGAEVQRCAIQGYAVTRLHRILSVTISCPDRDEAVAIAQATQRALEEENARYFTQLGARGALVTVIDPAIVTAVPPSLRERLDLPIRLALGVLGGLGLAFLLDYLDTSIRTSRDAESLGVPVLGRLPGRKRGSWWPWRRPPP